MNVKEYIESGILELYVAGVLDKKENKEIYEQILQSPEILEEVLKIETTIIKLTGQLSPSKSEFSFSDVQEKIKGDKKVVKLTSTTHSRGDWSSYTGWAAAIIFAFGVLWLINKNSVLEDKITLNEIKQSLLEEQIAEGETSLATKSKLLSILRDKEVIAIPLTGQGDFSDAFAKVYWDKKADNLYLDVQGLPEPPQGKVYQVWSLTLEPLTPTSLGVIESFATDENKIFEIANPNTSEAFAITLEPEGGSESPTMEQLYTLGIVTP